MKAREFAREELRPQSLARDQIEGGFGPWDWEIIRKGSQLGFRTLAVPEEWGGPGADFVTQGIVMAELASGDSAMSKAFSQNWKWSHQIAEFCTRDQKERFLKPFLADDTYVMGSGSTEPNAGSDNRYPPEDDPQGRLPAARGAPRRRVDTERREGFIANGSVGQALLREHAHQPRRAACATARTVFLVPIDTPGFRIGKVFNKSGLALLPERGADLRERARAARQRRGRGERRHEGAQRRVRANSAISSSRRTRSACATRRASTRWRYAKSERRGGKLLFEHQLVQLKINEMHALTEALRSFVHARRLGDGPPRAVAPTRCS